MNETELPNSEASVVLVPLHDHWTAFLESVESEVSLQARLSMIALCSHTTAHGIYPQCNVVGGAAQAVWSNGDNQLEVTFLSNGTVDWFFSNEAGSTLAGGEGPLNEEMSAILHHLPTTQHPACQAF